MFPAVFGRHALAHHASPLGDAPFALLFRSNRPAKLAGAALPPDLDERFLGLWDDVRYGARSRRYFDRVLWPRLLALAGRPLVRPRHRRGLGRRGPSLAALERVIADIEGRP